MPESRTIAFKIPEGWVKDIDKLVRAGVYPNRAYLIRDAVRLLLKRELWNNNHDCNGSWRLKTITVKVSEKMLEDLRKLIRAGRYPNVAEILRVAARDLLERELNLEIEDVTAVTSFEPKRVDPEKYLEGVEEHG